MPRKRIEGTQQLFEESQLLSAAISDGEQAERRDVAVDLLLPNRFNPRHEYPAEALEELVASMREHGFIGALDGRELPGGKVELAYGSRRLLAARQAGIRTVPVILRNWDDNRFRFIALVENLVREDLSPLEQAQAVGELHDALGMSIRDIAARLSKSKSWVEDRLAIYAAPLDVRQMVSVKPDSVRAARFIARLEDPALRQRLEEGLTAEELNHRQVVAAVQRLEAGAAIEEALPPQLSSREDSSVPPAAEAASAAAPASAGSPLEDTPAREPVSSREDSQSPESAAETGEAKGRASEQGQTLATAVSRASRSLDRLNVDELDGSELAQVLAELDALLAKIARLREMISERLGQRESTPEAPATPAAAG